MVRMRSSNLWARIILLLFLFGLCANTANALSGSGTEEDPWLIQSLVDFDEFASDANYWDDYTRLETDVNLAGRVYERAVIAWDKEDTSYFQGTEFTGIFDGNNHVVSNFTCDSNDNDRDYIGLFGYVSGSTSGVRNLGLIDPNIDAETGLYIGSLVGVIEYGAISDCYAKGVITSAGNVCGLIGRTYRSTINNCGSEGSISGNDRVGGLVGYSEETSVIDCYATGSVTGHDYLGGLCGRAYKGTINNSQTRVSITGNDHLGGLCGFNDEGPISNCYATGSVMGGDDRLGGLCGGNEEAQISNCYAIGSVTGTGGSLSIGGLCGFSDSGYIVNSYATGSVASGNNSRSVGGLCGSNSYGTVSTCFSSGTVDCGVGSEQIGGLCGRAFHGTVTDSYFLDTSGPDNSLGIPLIAIEMQQQSTFEGWDFINVWDIGQNQTYPYLRTVPAGDINKDETINFLDLCIIAQQWCDGE